MKVANDNAAAAVRRVDFAAVRREREQLAALVRAHPELAGPRSAANVDRWENVLRGADGLDESSRTSYDDVNMSNYTGKQPRNATDGAATQVVTVRLTGSEKSLLDRVVQESSRYMAHLGGSANASTLFRTWLGRAAAEMGLVDEPTGGPSSQTAAYLAKLAAELRQPMGGTGPAAQAMADGAKLAAELRQPMDGLVEVTGQRIVRRDGFIITEERGPAGPGNREPAFVEVSRVAIAPAAPPAVAAEGLGPVLAAEVTSPPVAAAPKTAKPHREATAEEIHAKLVAVTAAGTRTQADIARAASIDLGQMSRFRKNGTGIAGAKLRALAKVLGLA